MLGPLSQSRVVFALISGLAFTAWDLFLDPQMVQWRLWIWDRPPPTGYFGIPWTNYAGWFLCAATLTAALSPPSLPYVPLIAVYVLTWFLKTVGQVAFWHLPGPGFVGAIGMGIFAIGALSSL
jgi:lycopene beta-cyclase